MDNATAVERARFFLDLRLAQDSAQRGVSLSGRTKRTGYWAQWVHYCTALGLEPTLRHHQDPIPYLQVFAVRVRDGQLSLSGQPVQADTVRSALRAVGQTLSLLGTQDIRIDKHGNIDLRLTHQTRAYAKNDPAPTRLPIIPTPILRDAVDHVYLHPGANNCAYAASELIAIAFYFLLRPGEHCDSGDAEGSHPFHLADVEFFLGQMPLDIATATNQDLLSATSVKLTFTTQKNANRGEKIGQATSGHQYFCPVRAVARRVIHLRSHGMPPNTPLHAYYSEESHKICYLHSRSIRTSLRLAASRLDPNYDLTQIQTKCLRASGATALLHADVDTDMIRLTGRWLSDAMLRYLHAQIAPITHQFAQRMGTINA